MLRNEQNADRVGTNDPEGVSSSEVTTAEAAADFDIMLPAVFVVGADHVEERDIPRGRVAFSVMNWERSR